MFRKLLIANRGEIACRVVRTARRLGIATVAVYSDADRDALHVDLADEAIRLGPAPPADSYLRIDRVIDAARRSGAEAIHPGYGFLSENAEFCRACEAAGLVFVGPPAPAIEAMGSKSAAKRIMGEAGVPLLPGYHGDDQDPATLRQAAAEVGYPVLLKAAAGGGGKGMRLVESAAQFDAGLAAARREAAKAFGDDRMLVEKFLRGPRHVEVQVFCDAQGGAVYLFERDCSVQRRHQKIIEEAPAPGLDAARRAAMGEAAVRAARAIDYRGAGTVEFLLGADGAFYFMEMNTRLQVEHPVTEMVTGEDLVEWQLRVAAGEALPKRQQDLRCHGHAFEARIYAEDPDADFLPATGRLTHLQPPEESRHVRVDSGVIQGDEVSVHYDPMIAKLVTWDESRERALARLATALAEYQIHGVVTNTAFLYNIATSAAFRSADVDTGFIERHRDQVLHRAPEEVDDALPVAGLYLVLREARRARAAARSRPDAFSPWSRSNAWRLNEPHRQRLDLLLNGEAHTIHVEAVDEAPGRRFYIDVAGRRRLVGGELEGTTLHLDVDGHRRRVTVIEHDERCFLFRDGGVMQFGLQRRDYGDRQQAGPGAFLAPMNGTVVACLVEPGRPVAAGEPLLIMEAMKMEHTLSAPAAGSVSAFFFGPGDLVAGGDELLAFAPDEA
jgi:3-methylcrotonyl-CoA carboxylase alpha subunit